MSLSSRFSKCADEGKQEFLTEVNVLRTEQQASFSVGKDSVGCTDDPDPFVITLNNLSEGDSLAYTWTVTPQQGVSFAEGDTNSDLRNSCSRSRETTMYG